MGNLTLNGATSGQITLAPPAVAGTNTLTFPAKTGNIITSADTGTVSQAMLATGVAGNGPAFHASAGGAQTVTSGTNTLVTLVEDFDTNSNFASNRFTPTVAGYYQINAVTWATAGTSMTYTGALIYKNGTQYSLGYGAAWSSTGASGSVSDIVYLNGSTDYVELYIRVSGTGTLTINSNTFFSGCLVRGA